MVTVIAGRYGPTEDWGLYTMFPGASAPSFPNDKQSAYARAESTKFWNEHGFLATPEEIADHLKKAKNECMAAKAPEPDLTGKYQVLKETTKTAAGSSCKSQQQKKPKGPDI